MLLSFSTRLFLILAIQLKQTRFDCFEKSDAGMCRALFSRFYHDKDDGECKPFYYGGCDGNNNNFATIEECENKCKNKDHKITVENENEVTPQIGN